MLKLQMEQAYPRTHESPRGGVAVGFFGPMSNWSLARGAVIFFFQVTRLESASRGA